MASQYRNIYNWTPWFVLLIVVLALAGTGLANNLGWFQGTIAATAQ
ncbi:hypothetical protein [Pelagibacterium limicola]|nr:hypothetical protein [Pelagibacterium limicola]